MPLFPFPFFATKRYPAGLGCWQHIHIHTPSWLMGGLTFLTNDDLCVMMWCTYLWCCDELLMCLISGHHREKDTACAESIFRATNRRRAWDKPHDLSCLLHLPHLSPMGKQQPTTYHQFGCNDDSAPIRDSDCCKISHETKIIYNVAVASNLDNPNHDNRDDTIPYTNYSLLVVGAGIHSHA